MTRSATPKLGSYIILVAGLLVAAFAAHRPEMVVVATPFALLAVAGLVDAQVTGDVDARVEVVRERAIEGGSVEMRLSVAGRRRAELVDIAIGLPEGLEPAVRTLTMSGRGEEEPRSVNLEFRCARWGAYTWARCGVRARSPFGFFHDERLIESRYSLRVYPRAEALRSFVVPRDTQPFAGNLVARGAGSGVEFAELRPFQPGDELRSVNWRVTARRGEMWVTARHPERNADVILFLDTFADVRGAGGGTLDLTVRAAAAVAARYLRDRERVGVVGFGGTLRWLTPGSGQRQFYQIVESLITTELTLSYAWKDVSIIPPQTLPAQALVIALTPLIDERSVQALVDLLHRGFDLAIIELRPDPYLPVVTGETARLARRIWQLDRAALLGRFRELGAAVSSWDDERPLATAVEEVKRFRQHARIVRAS